jgi:hypothetical protein
LVPFNNDYRHGARQSFHNLLVLSIHVERKRSRTRSEPRLQSSSRTQAPEMQFLNMYLSELTANFSYSYKFIDGQMSILPGSPLACSKLVADFN